MLAVARWSAPICKSAWTAVAFSPIVYKPTRAALNPRKAFSRQYQHSSQHAPSNALQTTEEGDGDQGTYSRWSLMSAWHRAARQQTPADLEWEGRDDIDAQHVIIRPDGSVERPERPMKKHDLIKLYGLQPRELRHLDSHILDVGPALLVCQGSTNGSIVFCSPIFRAVIAHDHLVCFPADNKNPICSDGGAGELIEAVCETLGHLNFKPSAASSKVNIPFELKALEALLILTTRGFKTVTAELQERVYNTIPQLRFGVSPAELKNLMEAKRTCEDALMAGRAFQSALLAVLNEDADLAAMYLTDRANGKPRPIAEHETAELLLENYERATDEANESAVRLQSLLTDIDSNISLVLQSTRVRLQNLELQTAIFAAGAAAATMVAGVYGQNLWHGYEEHPTAFYWATGGGLFLMAGVMAIGFIRLFRNRRSQLFLRAYLRAKPENLKEIQRGRMGNLENGGTAASTHTVSRKEHLKQLEQQEDERREDIKRLDEKDKKVKKEQDGKRVEDESTPRPDPSEYKRDGSQL